MGKVYLYVGNWGFHPAPKGISTFEYDEDTGNLTLLKTILPEISAGQLCLDKQRNILYAVNECGDRKNEYGGGGELLAFKIELDGSLTLISRRDSLCPEPCYICLDCSGKYILISHHCDPWHVTKLVRNPDGTITNEVLFDDGSIVLFRLDDDGRIGDAIDALIYPSCNRLSESSKVNVDPVTGHIQLVQIMSRLHSVMMSPDGEMFITSDKGLDKVRAFKLDRESGKLYDTDTFDAKWCSFPRYGAFHPTLPLFYSNNENCADLDVLRYDSAAGTLEPVVNLPILFEDPGIVEGKPVGAQDIIISPDGQTLYVTLCGINSISVLHLDENGIPELKQVIETGGNLPRCLTLSPDGRFLFSGNMVSNDISSFEVSPDGTLKSTGKIFKAVSPSAMRFFRTT